MNKLKFIIGIGVIISLIFVWMYYGDFSPPKNDVIEKLNELELKIDSINSTKNSIRTVIDSTHIKIVTNEKHYEKRIDVIINQPTDSDYEFVTTYARQHRNKRIGNNMSGT